MKIRTLECFCEIARSRFSLSEAARNLNATQPALTRQVKLLEEELGFPVLLRRGNKAIGFTEGGRIVFERAQIILNETRQLGLLKEQLSSNSGGRLVVATTQFHARYTLLPTIIRFRPTHPEVSVSILSCDPAAAVQLVLAGNADFALCSEVPDTPSQLTVLACFELRRLVIVPRGHPLTRVKRLSLQHIARYPLILYDAPLSGGRQVLRVFEEHGLTPEIALNAMDADVIKSYVAAGIGIAVIQELAYDEREDSEIQALDPGTLFRPTTAHLTIRKGSVLKAFTRDFIALLAPRLDI